MCRVGVHVGGRGERLQRVRRCGRLQDRRELDRVETIARCEAGALEEAEVEADVVADDRRRPDERVEPRQRDLGRRRTDEVVVRDAGEARDGAVQRLAGIDERAEAFADRDAAVGRERDARGADLDDAVVRGVEAGCLEIERDEFYECPLLGVRDVALATSRWPEHVAAEVLMVGATDAAAVLMEAGPPRDPPSPRTRDRCLA